MEAVASFKKKKRKTKKIEGDTIWKREHQEKGGESVPSPVGRG